MKKVLLSLFVIGITLTAFCQKKETRTVSDFTKIDASSVFEITVTKGSTESLVIEAEDNVMPYVRSEVKDGVLHLYLESNKVKNVKKLKAAIMMKNLESVSLSGACNLSASDLFTPDNFTGGCSGASGLNLNLKTNSLSLDTSGASDIQIKADVATDTNIELSGSSKMNLKLNTNKARITSSGIGNITISGSATDFKVTTSGSSNIKAVDFAVKSATVESSGSSSLEVNVTETLVVHSSGAASIGYKGSPSIDMHGKVKLQKL